MSYIVKTGDKYLGRSSLESPLRLVPRQFAYVYDTEDDACDAVTAYNDMPSDPAEIIVAFQVLALGTA